MYNSLSPSAAVLLATTLPVVRDVVPAFGFAGVFVAVDAFAAVLLVDDLAAVDLAAVLFVAVLFLAVDFVAVFIIVESFVIV